MIDLSEDRRSCGTCAVGRDIVNAECDFCRNYNEYVSDKYHDEFGWKIEPQSEKEINEALCDIDVMGEINCNNCDSATWMDSCSWVSSDCDDCNPFNYFYNWYPCRESKKNELL